MSKPANSPNLKVADLTGDSEEFVLPKAPPLPHPTASRHSASSQQANQVLPSAGEVAGDDAPVPAMPATSQGHRPKLPPLQSHDSTVQEVGLDESRRAEVRKTHQESPPVGSTDDSDSGKNGLIGVILILLLVIGGLLILMGFGEPPQQTPTNPVVPHPEEIEGKVNELQGENETMSRQLVEMTAQIKQLKEQLESVRNAKDKAVSDLGRANSAADKELTGLRSEVARLQTLVRNSRPPEETKSTVREPLPEPQVAGTVYRVSGLREGDTLNVRSGPGSGFSVVTQLHLGVRITVTGTAVANGTDWWLPCYVSGQVTDPATGASKPWTAKGWINSAFLEEE